MYATSVPRVIRVICLLFIGYGVKASGQLLSRVESDEEILLNHLFQRYNPAARPVINSSSTVDVRIQFSLLQIQELNLRNQVLTTTGLLILEWRDERLQWQPEKIPLTEVVIEAELLWRPEFASINGADGIYGEYGQFRAIIASGGQVHWEPGGVFKTVCEIDITYYPFDEQHCRLIFGAWSYDTSKMNLTNMNDTVNLDSYEENGEWDIIETTVKRNEFAFDCCPNERFANVEFSIYMRRRYTFYIMNVILPSLMTSVLLLSIFFCTPAQKVQIGVVVLLSFRIFLLNVTDSIPKTSDHIPLLGIYLTCTMAITTLSMVLTVFILNLHHITDRPVPHWLQRVVLFYLARVLCMCQRRPVLTDVSTPKHKKSKSMQNGLGKAIGSQIGILAGLNGTLANPGAVSSSPGSVKSRHQAKDQSLGNIYVNRHGVHFKSSFTYNEESPGEKIDSKKQEEEWAKDWRHLAEVIDRLFFWLFLTAIVVTTLILFHPLTKAYFSLLGDGAILRSNGHSTQPTTSL